MKLFTFDQLFNCLCACYCQRTAEQLGGMHTDFMDELYDPTIVWDLQTLPAADQQRLRNLVDRVVSDNLGAFEKYYSVSESDDEMLEHWRTAIECLVPALEKYQRD